MDESSGITASAASRLQSQDDESVGNVTGKDTGCLLTVHFTIVQTHAPDPIVGVAGDIPSTCGAHCFEGIRLNGGVFRITRVILEDSHAILVPAHKQQISCHQ